MAAVEYRRGEYRITTDAAQLNVLFVHRFLSQSSYWAQQRPLTVVEKSIAHSLCFGLYVDRAQRTEREQVGFARVVTNQATFRR